MDQPYELITLDALDAVTRGQTMSRLAKTHHVEMQAKRELAEIQILRAMQVVKKVGEVQANQNICGLRAVAEIPQAVQAAWRAKFITAAEKANVKGVTGYECWRDTGKDGFMTRFRKINPEFFYKELKKGNSIINPGTRHLVGASKYCNVREAAAA